VADAVIEADNPTRLLEFRSRVSTTQESVRVKCTNGFEQSQEIEK
jgi:hypothetical protein